MFYHIFKHLGEEYDALGVLMLSLEEFENQVKRGLEFLIYLFDRNYGKYRGIKSLKCFLVSTRYSKNCSDYHILRNEFENNTLVFFVYLFLCLFSILNSS